jgi:uncharacterized Zn finger protein
MAVDGLGVYYCEECGTEIDGRDGREITITCEGCGVIFNISQRQIVQLKRAGRKLLCAGCLE